MNARLRPTKFSDYNAINKLLKTEGMAPAVLNEKLFKKMLRQNAGGYFVVEFDGQVIGSIFSTNDGGFLAYIYKLVVAPLYRRQALARLLAKKVLTVLRKKDIKYIHVFIDKHNRPSEKLFSSLGFLPKSSAKNKLTEFYYSTTKL